MLICNERHFFAVTQTEMKIEKNKNSAQHTKQANDVRCIGGLTSG